MPVFSYEGAAVRFEEATDGKTYLSTRKHGDLGCMWEEPNGTHSAKVGEKTSRHIGSSWDAFKWIIENQ